MPPCLRAFTLVEVLIVIVVISLLIAVIGLVGVKVLHGQKVALTEMTMRNVKIAIDRFAELDPLKNIYDRKDHVTFGPYPPYTLAAWTGAVPAIAVPDAVEPYSSYDPGGGGFFYILSDRLHRDLGSRQGNVSAWALIDETGPNAAQKRKDDDIRALYTYLKLYAADALAQVPATAMKPLDPTFREYANPTGTGTDPTNPETNGLVDIFGIYDAWGVPLDYFLYVKLEWDALANAGNGDWRVTQRIAVLRSRGISREEYDAEIGGTDALDPEKWIFSDPFPSPPADHLNPSFKTTGALIGADSSANGWARALGAFDEGIGYVP